MSLKKIYVTFKVYNSSRKRPYAFLAQAFSQKMGQLKNISILQVKILFLPKNTLTANGEN